MTAGPAQRGGPTPLHRSSGHTRPGRWAAAIAVVVAVVILVSFAIFAVAFALGGWAAVDDTWVGFIVAVSLQGGLVASLVAFVLAVVAKVKQEQWRLLWLPLLLFPAIAVFLLLGEVFWWE